MIDSKKVTDEEALRTMRTFTDTVINEQVWNYTVNGELWWYIGGLRISDAELQVQLASEVRPDARSRLNLTSWYERQV